VNESSLWHNLPKVCVDKDQFVKLFELKEAKSYKSSSHRKISSVLAEKQTQLLVLDTNRSNAVNIAMRKLPPLGSLETTILRMDSSVINREGVERLQSLYPSKEEIEKIKEALDNNPETPLGPAEKFLFILGNIPSLEARLNLWMFKMDFEAMERDVCKTLNSLNDSIKVLTTNKTFLTIISVALSLGNLLNRTNKPAFEIESLSKLSRVRDTETRKSLLYHVASKVSEIHPTSTDLHSELEPLIAVSKANFSELETNLGSMEEECKKSLGYIKLAAKFDLETKKLVSAFLSNAAERIMAMKRVHRLLMARYGGFLDWLGLVQHKDYPPTRLANIVKDFAIEYKAARTKVLMDREIEKKKLARSNTMPPKVSTAEEKSNHRGDGLHKTTRSHSVKPWSAPQNVGSGLKVNSGEGKDGLEAMLAEEAVSLRTRMQGKRSTAARINNNVKHQAVNRER